MATSLQVDAPFAARINPQLIENAVTATLDFVNQDQASLVSVVVTDTAHIQHLNQLYRGLDSPTDVLSFQNTPDAGFPHELLPESPYLGDIIIAYPVAEAQANLANHTPAEEVALLTVHGTLHLLGFDHENARHKADMWAAQEQIMTGLGLAHVQPTET